MSDLKDWSNYNLSKESREAVTPTTEFSKSKSIYHIDKIQEQYMAKAKESGDRAKIRDADRFCVALEKEKSFLRNSK